MQALNLMWDHLKSGRPLPASQVVRTQAARAEGRQDRADRRAPTCRRSKASLGANTLISVGFDGKLRIPE